jgi:hypothetical protein
MRSMRFSRVQSRRPPRNLLQNHLEKQIPAVSSIEPEAILIQIGLQIFRADAAIEAADSPLQFFADAMPDLGC